MRYHFEPAPEGHVDIREPAGALTCWLPGALAEELEHAYLAKVEIDWVVANEWFAGVLVGVHASLAFGNQRPAMFHEIRRGLSAYQMGEPL